ncbi:polyprotein [Rhynchospora pubera]|uniref:Polyprotein n=1 Tax=Rhynchospora pubera TaxID=906938 RepID=A0AAV8GBR8_9POAL|nr:polyprotein [Rhynchospora pubera]
MHMQGNSETWVQGITRPNMLWGEFVQEVLRRFESKTTLGLVGEFNKLKQSGDVESYRNKFEELKLLLLKDYPMYDESYFITSYLSGLREDIRLNVLSSRPRTLNETYEASIYQEMLIEHKKKQNFQTKIQTSFQKNSSGTRSNPNLSSKYSPYSPSGVKTKEKKECYYCHLPWTPGHRCRTKALNVVTGHGDPEDSVEWPAESDTDEDEGVDPTKLLLPQPAKENEEEVRISLHAIGEVKNLDLIRIKGNVNGVPVIALVDSGSTHSFIDPKVVKNAGYTSIQTRPLEITVANGEKMQCDKKCEGFTWSMQGEEFRFDLKVMEIVTYEMLLGGDWIKKVGPVLLDVNKLSLAMIKGGKRVVLKGVKEEPKVHAIDGELKVVRAVEGELKVQRGELCMLVQAYPVETQNEETLISEELQVILSSYSEIFKEPKELPPKRTHDHVIPLKEGAEPVNLRPYRYSHEQKAAIEKIIEEMMAASVIQPSSSPFASPAVLVKKKDGSWRLCIDYRRLNALTIKNKYPIPLIEELLEELKGAEIFSKIDLRAGYHQIRVREEDVPKTAFRVHHGHFEFKVMPFGLTNAPASFQNLMNDVFKEELRKSVLVFFDDILVYSKNYKEHIQHLKIVFRKLKEHNLFAKMSKCAFGVERIEYLGHIISKEGVATDAHKVEAMLNWPIPKNIKELRGFLGLTEYYRRFIKNYGIICKPLTELLGKIEFKWNVKAQEAFERLKKAMSSAPVLALPDFTQPFCIEADACETGLGAVLTQGGRPLAYLSKALGPKNMAKSTYEKELMAILMAVSKWRHYLQGQPFVIKTDHQSLKHLLEQKLKHQLQHKALTKFIGLDYSIQYKKGKQNVVADALSRRNNLTTNSSTSNLNYLNNLQLSQVQPLWMEEVKKSYEGDMLVEKLVREFGGEDGIDDEWHIQAGLVKKKNRLYVGIGAEVRNKIMEELHATAIGGHSGMQSTYHRIKRSFYWPGMKREICGFVKECDVCQRNKSENVPYPGLLQPLPIPNKVWSCITMDFIEGLPKSEGKSVIYVVVDRLTKYAHFTALSHPYNAQTVARVFMENVFKLHGLPTSIVSDRDKVFTSLFWRELFKHVGTTLSYSTAYHPQTDGQSERVNQCLETYLRCMANEHPKKWYHWLAVAEYWYNTSYHTSLKCTPFEALYGYAPPHMELGNPPITSIEPVDTYLKERAIVLQKLREQLQRAQGRMKFFADKNRTERELEVGDLVYLKLQPYRQTSVAVRKCLKLSSRYYGPFVVLEKIGAVAYRLQLPPGSQIHPIFHVSQLKKRIGKHVPAPSLPLVGTDGEIRVEPVVILDRKIINRNGTPVAQVLVRWSNLPDEASTWEDYLFIKKRFPEFDMGEAPRGQGAAGEGGTVTCSIEKGK